MIGHYVTCTVWTVTVTWRSDLIEGKPPEGKAPQWTSRDLLVLTASDDGSDVFEVTRRQCFADPDQARLHEFKVMQTRQANSARGTALGEHERRGDA